MNHSHQNFHEKHSSFGENDKIILEYLHNMERMYLLHKIDKAYHYGLEIDKLRHNTHLLKSHHHELNQKIKREMKDVEYYERILNQPTWELKQEKKNFKVSTQIEGQTVGVLV